MNNEHFHRPKRKKGNKFATKETNLEAFLEKRTTERNDFGETMVNLKDCEFDSWKTFKSCIRLIFQSSSIDNNNNTCCCRALNVSSVRVLSSSCEEEEEENNNNNNNSSLFLESLFEDEKEEEKKNTILERLREMNVSGNEKAFRNQKGCDSSWSV
jgi:hypothetical protein